MTVLQKVGIFVVVVSVATGGCGMLWNIYAPFVANSDADYAAIPSRWMDSAIWFAIAAIAGSAMGIAMVVLGRRLK